MRLKCVRINPERAALKNSSYGKKRNPWLGAQQKRDRARQQRQQRWLRCQLRYFALACKQASQVGQDENMSKSTFHIPDPLKTLEFQMFLVINRSSIYRKISVHQWQHFLRQRKFVLELRIQVLNMIWYIYSTWCIYLECCSNGPAKSANLYLASLASLAMAAASASSSSDKLRLVIPTSFLRGTLLYDVGGEDWRILKNATESSNMLKHRVYLSSWPRVSDPADPHWGLKLGIDAVWESSSQLPAWPIFSVPKVALKPFTEFSTELIHHQLWGKRLVKHKQLAR